MKEEKIYEIIAAYLAGESNEEQNGQLLEWIGQSERNKRIFKELRLTWNYALADREQMGKSKDLVFRKVMTSVRVRRFLKPAAAVAAMVCALTLGYVLAVTTGRPETKSEGVMSPYEGLMTMSTLPGQKAEATLPDGTKVWLNSGTTISYPTGYSMKDRRATLVEGEIFLDVAKKEGLPFILTTSDGLIKVHGTRFNVKNYASDPSMTISLQEGSIEYLAPDRKSNLMMVPGQKIVLDKVAGPVKEHKDSVEAKPVAMVLQKCDTEIESIWRFGELKIERESFLDVMAEMERWYGVEIEISGDIPKDSYYWMTIKTESLREMLGLLRKITPLSYEIDGKNVLIKLK